MKKTYSIISFCLIIFVLAWLFVSSSNGPASAQQRDRSGSPLSFDTDCTACHGGGGFGTKVLLQLQDTMGAEVKNYVNGQKYKLKVTLRTSTAPTAFGFQAVALSGQANSNAGAWGTLPAGIKKVALNSRDYVEHNSPRSDSIFLLEWTAPDSGADSVSFYVGGNAVNDDNDVSGDSGTRGKLVVQPLTTNLFAPALQVLDMTVSPNPFVENFRLVVASPHFQEFQFQLFDSNGRLVKNNRVFAQEGKTQLDIPAGQLPAGVYTAVLSNQQGLATATVVKQ